MDLVLLIVDALKFIPPAYVANAIPVVAGGGRPLDFGRCFIDGKPFFGQNKTLRGFFSGLVLGTGVGLAESFFFNYSIFFGLLVSLGALSGDLAGAFLKRRLGLAPGELLPVIDQIDFIVGAIVFSLPVFLQSLSLELVFAILVMTPPLHLLTNYVAYKLGLKNNPW